MTCKPCLEKWFKFYKGKGKTDAQAEFMAQKLVLRIGTRDSPRESSKVNVEASRFWGRTVFVGGSDYSLPCVGLNGVTSCVKDPADPCSGSNDGNCLHSCSGGTCACPAALPNSSQVSGACGQVYVGDCICNRVGPVYVCVKIGAVCQCAGVCGYNCNPGFVWNGVSCEPSGILLLKRMHVGL